MGGDAVRSEQAVLGSCIMLPETALPAALSVLSVDDFHVETHRHAFELLAHHAAFQRVVMLRGE